MTNNDVFKKLRVALMLRDDDIMEILGLVNFKIGKSELAAFFRKEDHPNYRECGDQILRNFLNGLVLYLRGTKENPTFPGAVLKSKPTDTKKSVDTQKNLGRPDFKTAQRKKVDVALSSVKYKNKTKNNSKKKS